MATPRYIGTVVLPFAGVTEATRLPGVTAFDVEVIADTPNTAQMPTLLHDINLAMAGLALTQAEHQHED